MNSLKLCVFKFIELSLKNPNQCRYYARWSHRRPRRVLTTDECEKSKTKNDSELNEERIIELEPKPDLLGNSKKKHLKFNQVDATKWMPKNLKTTTSEFEPKIDTINYKIETKPVKKKKQTYKAVKRTTDMLETAIDSDGNFIYTKLKDNDSAIGQLLLMVKSRREQIKKDLALLEGKRLIKEALVAGSILKTLIFSRKTDIEFLKPYLPKTGAKLYKMPYKEIQLWSDLNTTPGIMGIFQTPDVANISPNKDCLPITIVCDNIREPGNLGAILRTAAGVGVQSVILMKGCVDLWDTKVLRSACGAHFCLQIFRKMEWSNVREHIDNRQSAVFIADNKVITETIDPSKEETSLDDIMSNVPLLPYYGVKFDSLGSITVIVGGETHGISQESYLLASEVNGARLNIPLSKNVDSLNTGTALGIIMFEIKKQMFMSDFQNKNKFVVDNK